MNEISVTVRGNVATDPRHVEFDDGNIVTSFRLASTVRYFDRNRGEWLDRGTTFVSVNCRRNLARNAILSLRKGQPVIVSGRMRERFWETNGVRGRTIEVDAESMGHDLGYGKTEFERIVRSRSDQVGDEMAGQVVREAAAAGDPTMDVTGLPLLEPGESDSEDEFDELDDGPLDSDLADLVRDPALA